MKFYKAYPYLYLIMQQTLTLIFLKLTLFIDRLFIFFPTPPYYLHFLILGIWLCIYCFDRPMHTKMFFLDKKVWELSRAIKHSVFKKKFFQRRWQKNILSSPTKKRDKRKRLKCDLLYNIDLMMFLPMLCNTYLLSYYIKNCNWTYSIHYRYLYNSQQYNWGGNKRV